MQRKSIVPLYLSIFLISTASGFAAFLLIGYLFHKAFSWKLTLNSLIFGAIFGNWMGFSSLFLAHQAIRGMQRRKKSLNLIRRVLIHVLMSLIGGGAFSAIIVLVIAQLESMEDIPIGMIFISQIIGGAIGLGMSLLLTTYEKTKESLEKSYEKIKEKELLEKELQIAHQVQAGFLPRGPIQIKGFDVSTSFRPAKEVGGDYFDIIPLRKGVGIVIADVSGKGVPAALIMANLHATLHALAEDCSLDELVTRINRSIFENTSPELFVTFFYGVLNNSTGEFRYVNAGHNPPVIVRNDGAVEKLIQGGTVLGIVPDFKFEIGSAILNPRDLLLLYTDRLTEAGLPEIEPWGEDNLTDFLSEIHHNTAGSIIDLIVRQVEESTKGVVQTDDIALVLLKRN